MIVQEQHKYQKQYEYLACKFSNVNSSMISKIYGVLLSNIKFTYYKIILE